jgi:hypothetical protein
MKMAGFVPGGGSVGAGAGKHVGMVTAAVFIDGPSWKATD